MNQFFHTQNLLAGNAGQSAAGGFTVRDQAFIHMFMQDIVNDFNSIRAGIAQAVYELDFYILALELGGNCLAAAMDNHRTHADTFHKDNVAHGIFNEFRIFHGAAAEFNDHNSITEFLYIGQSFDQNFGFINYFLHCPFLF
jgi:hypothetical protein